ncbi:MAG: MBL fold metallo-hydrolase [Parcubacteria group bacterium]|nr:MBL fold metallo-hydrolase [Parcubacteria group bacterium]
MRITFYGGAKLVTGANYLLEDKDFLALVDCGLFQGSRFCEDLNYEPFPYEPKNIKYVFITHSHIDHTGRLPKLYKEGFRGKVFSTRPIRDILEHALPDSLNHLKREAEEQNREPIYSFEDVGSVIKLFETFDYDQKTDLGNGKYFILHDAGHILGSSIIEFGWSGGRILFSGDLGNPPTPLLRPTEYIEGVDYVVVESAYGNRIHENRDERKEILKTTIEETIKRGGVLMIPSFAMERTQELLFELNEMVENKRIPFIPIFIDSPLAIKLTEVYKKHEAYFNKEASYLIDSGDDIFKFPGLYFTSSVEESKSINEVNSPKIIIAGSGMSQGGRILHHERRYLSDPNSTILFVGYQAKGSLGRKILDGEKEVKIFGESILIKCKIKAIGGYSAHADQPGLVRWVKKASIGEKLKKVFIVQGEEIAMEALSEKLKDEISGLETVIPSIGDDFDL